MNGGMAHHFKKYMSMPRTSDCIVIQVRLVLSTAAVISFSPHQPGIISPYIAYVPPSKDIIYNIYTSCKIHYFVHLLVIVVIYDILNKII